MKFIKPTDVPRSDPTPGYVGVPQSREWLKEWIENKGRYVKLDCGCIDDMNDRTILIIKQFNDIDMQIYCEHCNRFAVVVKALTRRNPPHEYPETPMF